METEQPIHHEATLLPAYVSHNLTPEDQHQVENHLKGCSDCQRELQEVQAMKTALKTAIKERPGPSPEAFSKVMKRIRLERQTTQQENRMVHELSWWEKVENFFDSLFAVRWVPALASFLIIGQAVMLLSVLGGPKTQVEPLPEAIIERGIPNGTVKPPPIIIQVEFVKTAQEIQIRELLQELDGQILKGPTTEGFYTLGFAQTGMNSSEFILSALKTHVDLIHSVSLIQS